jgi:ribosome-associated heat shock protein Hsp15
MERVRIDKWLWAARFYKTRALAVKNCELGRVEMAGQEVKPAREVKVGDRLRVRTEGGDFEVDVVGLSEMRGPASVAQALYRETEASRERRALVAEQRRLEPQIVIVERGRPTKKDRRDLTRLRSR